MSSLTFYPVSMSDPRLSDYDVDYNVLDGIDAVIKTTKQRESCMWTYLRDNPPSESTGYMFSDNSVFGAIMNNMQVGHSGCSYAWTMRNLQYIASHGMDAYIDACSPKRKKPAHPLQTPPQVSASFGAVADL
jgi:hypothetical protein